LESFMDDQDKQKDGIINRKGERDGKSSKDKIETHLWVHTDNREKQTTKSFGRNT